ncbi:hypothetical protein HD806DRAFT_333775 [Xylariaceae sp. AK1471]|nr:hypothetical protein HD806DRAFT_333775 [Xylariaceae sp. AK1471]
MPVTRIAGSSQYVQLMQNLATSPIRRMFDGSRTPPGVDQNDVTTRNIWVWFKIKCWVRKLFFLPATPEIGILADMVPLLRRDVEAVLGQRVKSAALASPDRVRLTSYEIGDVFDYLWMEDLMADKNDPMFDQLYSMAAASAGNGDGLCLEYTNAYACGKEESSFQSLWTLQLDFSHQSLSGAMELAGTARRLGARHDMVDLTLGARHRPHQDQDTHVEQEYWDRLQTRIQEFVESTHRNLEKLYLTGDHASEPCFLEAVRNALAGRALPPVLKALENVASEKSAENFLFVTSMGAAEFAKRRLEGMARCLLPEECRGEKGAEVRKDDKEL